MRVLMWFTIGFAFACAIGAYIGVSILLGLVTLVIAGIVFFLRFKYTKILAILLLGITFGSLWNSGYQYFYLNAAREYDGKTVETVATVSDYSYETDYGVAADGKIKLKGKEFSIRLYLNTKISLQPGDGISGKIRLRLTTNDAIQEQTYHQGDGIFLLGYVQENASITQAEQVPIRFLNAKLRHDIQTILEKSFPIDTLGFANALFLGDSSLLDYKTDTDFKLSGIRHIIAVSGLHVSILMSVVFLLCGRNRYLSAVIGIPLLIIFAAVVGFTPSVMRACIMQGLVLIGMFLNKEYDPPTSLSFAVLVMLLVNPISIVSISLQLSVGCLIGILLFYEKVNAYIVRLLRVPKGKSLRSRLGRWFSSSVSITLSTFITTTPLSAAYFGSISIIGILTNLLTLWVVSFIFCGIILVILTGALWLPLAKVIAVAVSIPIRYVIFVAKLLGDLPFAAVYTKSVYVVVWLVASYCLFVILVTFKKRYPLIFCGCVTFLLLIAIGASWLEPRTDDYRISVFDVGQGQSILVQYQGRYYLTDCGGSSNRVAADTVSQHLLSQGITHLDGVIVTHYDKDHAGGIPNLLENISVDTLYLPDIQDESGLRDILSQTNCSIQWISGIERVRFSELEFTMVTGEHETRDNERSMCILFQVENYDILITGDRSSVGEKALLKKINLPQVDLLVAGHHGSGTATSLELLEKIRPDTVVISVGKDNYYGHPAEDLLYRLRLFECSIWRTDLDGTIVFRG